MIGKTVMMADGQELGTISDVIFNPENGEIMGYEISKGIIDDLLTGRNILSGHFSPYSGNDVIVVPISEEIQVKPNNGGIINKLSDL
ncbi:MAG: PRC-barrel domain-containing protein [Caldicoprobacterales bacterium]